MLSTKKESFIAKRAGLSQLSSFLSTLHKTAGNEAESLISFHPEATMSSNSANGCKHKVKAA